MYHLKSPSSKENLSNTEQKFSLSQLASTPQVRKNFLFSPNILSPPVTLDQPQKTERRSSSRLLSFNLKSSNKENGIVKAYSVITDKGLVRNYNEDRVSIILNILKPENRANETWPHCSFFGVYDGHGGSKCADFLRDNLHSFVIANSNFPFNANEAILAGFRQAEAQFMATARGSDGIDRSGSCALVVLIVGDLCFVANLGDSRGLLSGQGGKKLYLLSKDHKPEEELEKKRILESGGKVYQSCSEAGDGTLNTGPFRVFPGRLSVSRTFGDFYAKLPELGGNPGTIISIPEVKAFKILKEHDFILLGSDGIFDKLANKEILQAAWTGNRVGQDSHSITSQSVNNVMSAAMSRKSLDNLTVVMIAFSNFFER
jgi:protein phosphatase 2C family protein 2/3